jgi:hypothetical protein
MNPLVIQTVKKAVTNKYVMFTAIAIVVFLFFKKSIKSIIEKFKEGKFDKHETKQVNQIAQQYRSAANPSGIKWMIDVDGTNEKAVERLAYQTKDKLEPVATAYKQKFHETLTDRMRKELTPDDFQDWKNIVD